MALEMHVGVARVRVPELNTAVLATGQDPAAIRCERNTEHKVAVTREGPDASSAVAARLTSGRDR